MEAVMPGGMSGILGGDGGGTGALEGLGLPGMASPDKTEQAEPTAPQSPIPFGF